MPSRLHAVMQHADDFDNARFTHAIEEDMYWIGNRCLAAFFPTMANVKAAKAGNELGMIEC